MSHRCDKTSDDPKDHLGPFKHQQTWEDHNLVALKCERCGNTVMHGLKEEENRRQERKDAKQK
jgi:hypothetical protein